MKRIIPILLVVFGVMYAGTFEPCLVYKDKGTNSTELVIDINESIKACTQAVQKYPDESLYSYTLGEVYGEANDNKNAFKWYRKAAELGNAMAQERVGEVYYFGNGVTKDYKKAFKWYMKAAEQGVPAAQYRIGRMYEMGQWATKNNKKAFKWNMKAAMQNHPDAQYTIGSSYFHGTGIKQDTEKALAWYMKAVKQNHATTHFIIAFNYHHGGLLVRKNYKKAFEWYLKAAKLGFILAAEQLGLMYAQGEGVERNLIKAYAWLSLYLKDGLLDDEEHKLGIKLLRDRTNKLLDLFESKMTPQQIAIAQNYDPLKENTEVENKPDTKQTESSQTYTGTGFFVDKSTVLTNHHVVENCKSIELVRKGYKSTANIKAKDSINDLAILEADKTNGSSLNFRAGKGIRIGEDIIVIGYPLGYLLGSGIKLTTGNVSALTGLINDTTNMQLTAPVQPGNSGGALLDESGNVVGVIVARLKKEQNVNLAIKSNVAQMFLDINNVDYGVAMSKDKKDVADIADEAKESIVQVVCHQ